MRGIRILVIVAVVLAAMLGLVWSRAVPDTPSTAFEVRHVEAASPGATTTPVPRRPTSASAGSVARTPIATSEHDLVVVVVDEDGLPVEGATVTCTAPDGKPIEGVTDAHGRCTFARTRDGHHRVAVVHADFFTIETATGGRAVDVDRDVALTFQMQAMYGAAFAVPPECAVDTVDWDEPLDCLDRRPATLIAQRGCLAALQARLPGALVYCGRPAYLNPELGPLEIPLSVIAMDGSVWQGVQALRPLREIVDARPLELREGMKMRRVQIELCAPSGARLDVPLLVASAERPRGHGRGIRMALPGQSLWLAHGRYLAEPYWMTSWFSSSRELPFEIGATDPADDKVRLRFRTECVPIELAPTVADSETLPAYITVDDVDLQGITMIWRPTQGPIRLLVPAGPLTIKSAPGHYRPIDLQLELAARDRGRSIPLALVAGN